MYPVLGILTLLPPQESLNYLGRRAETGHKCRNFKIIIGSFIPYSSFNTKGPPC
ncbi:MAG: hypothetical protein QOG17_3101 [Gammaproteobacteria bacterium]|nr:hypothetical protein [Gammaproteobacteria bacterium]